MATHKEGLPEFPEDKVVESGLGEYVDVLRKAHALCNECKAHGVTALLVMDVPVGEEHHQILTMGQNIQASFVLTACKDAVAMATAIEANDADMGSSPSIH